MFTGRLEPQDETENVSGVFYDYSERSSLSSPPAERPDGEKKRKKSHLSRRVRRVVTGCCHVADPHVNAKEISSNQMTKAGSVNVFTRELWLNCALNDWVLPQRKTKSYLVFPRQTVLMEIREWLDAHPKEVVILSFSHFLGLSQELHMLLLTTIRNVFTSKLCPKTVRLLVFEWTNTSDFWILFNRPKPAMNWSDWWG